MATPKKKCQVFIPDPKDYHFEVECGEPADGGSITVSLPTGKGHANVDVCAKHKGILNSQAAQLRTASKVVR